MTNETENNDNIPVKMPFLKTMLGGYGLLIDNFKSFIIIGSIFSILLLLIYFISGQDIMCNNGIYRQSHYCTDSIINYIIIHILGVFIFCMFIRCWGEIVFNKNVSLSYKSFIPKISDIKILGLFLVYFIALAVAGVSIYLLYKRVPNPDWRIEILYFTLVSLGFLVPLYSLRFLSYFAFVVEKEPLPSMYIVWNKTRGNTAILLISSIILMLIGIAISFSLIQNILMIKKITFITSIGSEYLSNMASIMIAICFINYCKIQKEILFERNDNDKK